MARRFLYSPVALISVAWAILLPLGLLITAKVAIILVETGTFLQPLFSKVLLAAIVMIGAFLTGGILGIPISYELAHIYPKMSFSKAVTLCLGWALAFVIVLLLLLLILTTAQRASTTGRYILLRSLIPGSIFFAGLMLIPGTIGGIFTGLVDRQLQASAPGQYRTISVIAAWPLALAFSSAIGYAIIMLLFILLKSPYVDGAIPFWILGVGLASVGALTGAIGSIITFLSKPDFAEIKAVEI